MNVQAEKIELIKLIADLENEQLIRKIKDMLISRREKEKRKQVSKPTAEEAGLRSQEAVLQEVWKDESDEEWSQYINS